MLLTRISNDSSHKYTLVLSYLTSNNIVILKSGLEVTQVYSNWVESLGAVSYLPSIVTMALSCIISKIKGDTGRKS